MKQVKLTHMVILVVSVSVCTDLQVRNNLIVNSNIKVCDFDKVECFPTFELGMHVFVKGLFVAFAQFAVPTVCFRCSIYTCQSRRSSRQGWVHRPEERAPGPTTLSCP